jgi:hypothetical protein
MISSTAFAISSKWPKVECFRDFFHSHEVTKPFRIAIDWLMLTECGSSSSSLHFVQDILKNNLLTRRIIRFPAELKESFIETLSIVKSEEPYLRKLQRISDLFFDYVILNIKSLCHIAKGVIHFLPFLTVYENYICRTVSLIGLTLTNRKLYQNSTGLLSYYSLNVFEKTHEDSQELYRRNLYLLISIAGNINNLIRKNLVRSPLGLVFMATAHLFIAAIKFSWEYHHNHLSHYERKYRPHHCL